MPGRRFPREVSAYLGTSRPALGLVEKVIEQCAIGKMMGDAGLTDYDPLIVVLNLVTVEIEGYGKTLDDPRVRKAWRRIVRRLQDDTIGLEHNTFLPCRRCDQAFQPVINDQLLSLYLEWHKNRSVESLLAIHRCPACGGTLKALRTKTYQEDWHTPEPGTVASDQGWSELLLQHTMR